jgi:hypothetical protein
VPARTFKRFAPDLMLFAAARINPMSDLRVAIRTITTGVISRAALKNAVDMLRRQHRTHCNYYCNTIF